MTIITKSLLVGSALAVLIAAPAFADTIDNPTAVVDNDQSALESDVWGFAGNEADTALAVTSAGVALGNTASATTSEDVSLQADNVQELRGHVESQAQGLVRQAGPMTTTGTTYGNTFTAENGEADIGVNSNQTIGEGGWIKSRALIEAAEYAENATATAVAGANTTAVISESGYAGADVVQSNGAELHAEAEILSEQADIPVAVGTSFAVMNNADLATQGEARLAGEQTNSGDGNARTVVLTNGTYGATGAATITGNNLNMINEGGVGAFDANQTNSGDLKAESFVDAGAFPGVLSSTATAIGNSASTNTTGPQSDINIVQNNQGAVLSDALVTGVSGMVATTNASAYGNSATGTLCNCDGAMTARNVQTNSGPVRGRAYNYAGDAAALTATTVAAGNTATYTVGSPEG